VRQAGIFLALALGMTVITAAAARSHVWIVAITSGVLALWLGSLAVRGARRR
jgi:hypothetical protein